MPKQSSARRRRVVRSPIRTFPRTSRPFFAQHVRKTSRQLVRHTWHLSSICHWLFRWEAAYVEYRCLGQLPGGKTEAQRHCPLTRDLYFTISLLRISSKILRNTYCIRREEICSSRLEWLRPVRMLARFLETGVAVMDPDNSVPTERQL